MNAAQTQVDLAIRAEALLDMTSRDPVYDPVVLVESGRIRYAGPAAEAPPYSARRTIEDREAVVLPGLVDTHTHVGAHFFGTLCDDENVITALYDVWFPLERGYDEATTRAAAGLGMWDALRSGVTTVANDEYFPEATASRARELGIRCLVANRINEFANDNPPRYDRELREFRIALDRDKALAGLEENLDFIERWRDDPLVRPCLGPHAPDLLSSEMLQRCAAEAERLDVKMLMHVAQSEAEVTEVRSRGYRGSIHYLHELGVLSPRLQGAHMVWLDDEEIELAAAAGMGMSWTPTIMMACQSYAKIDRLIASGLPIGFGTDCFSMDVLEELRYALYSANYVRQANGHFRLTAYELLRIATLGGARCLGLDGEIGTVEAGKRADLIVVNLRDAQLAPNTNYFETLAYRAKGRNVTHTIVDGQVVFEAGRLQLADQDELFDEGARMAEVWVSRSADVLEATGLTARIQPHFAARGR